MFSCMDRVHRFRKAFVKNFTAINLTSHESKGTVRKANLPKERITCKIFIVCKTSQMCCCAFLKESKTAIAVLLPGC